jgi:hypothetical protein
MNSKTGVVLSIGAIAAVIVLFATGPLAATQAQAFGGFGGFHRGFGFGFHRGFGFGGFHRGFGFGFHRGFGFRGFGGWGGGWGGGCGGCGGCF